MATDHRHKLEKQNPSFSSTLLDKIYNSIDECDAKIKDSRLCREAAAKKQSNVGAKINTDFEEKEIQRLRRAYFLEKLMEKKVREKAELEKKSKLYPDHDALFSSSGSNSSDSDNESLKTTTTSCFSRPKPIRTIAPPPERKTERTRSALFYNSDTNQETQKLNFESFTKPKSKTFNFHRNLKQPISPGARIAAFLNSVFASARTGKNSKNQSLAGAPAASNFSSAPSSLSRSYTLSKRSPAATREKSAGPVQRTVRFVQYDAVEEEKKRRFEEAATEYLKRYQNDESNAQNDSDDDDDGDASCSSSDLFELDHIKVMGCDRYREELPVYETTTRLDRNRAIGNGLTM